MKVNTIFSWILLFLFLRFTSQQWSEYAGIRTGQVTMVSAGSTYANFSAPISFNITYTSTITLTTSAGLGIVGFTTTVSNQFSVNLTIVNFFATTMRITAIVLDDTIITFLTANYIAVGSVTYFLQVQSSCFLPSIINIGNGTRVATRTGSTFFINKILACNVYLSGFRMHNSQGLNNFLQATVACPANSSTLSYSFVAAQNNTVTLICYTTIIFCQSNTQIQYYQFGAIGGQVLTQSILPSIFNVPGRYQAVNRAFWGISGFNISRGNPRLFSLDTTYYVAPVSININYKTNPGVNTVNMNYFWIARRGCNTTALQWFNVPSLSCIADGTCSGLNLSQTLGGSARYCQVCDYTCLQCTKGALAQNCTKCDSMIYRVLDTTANTCSCQPGYLDVGVKLCVPCQYSIGGCNTCLSSTVCTMCNAGFNLTASGICQCTSGFLVTGICTTIYGCVNVTNHGGTISCLACNTTANYLLNGSTCICATGYYMDTFGNCVAKCGDGYITAGESCDDGNEKSGDGCSSTCTVEQNYYCDNIVQPSICKISSDITGTVSYAIRLLNRNAVQIGIKLQPSFNEFNYMNWQGMTSSMPCQSISTSYKNNLLVVTCDYTKTIQLSSFNLTMALDTKYFTNNSTLSVDFFATALNAKLTYDKLYAINAIGNGLVITADAIAIIVIFLTMFTQRMIGVQLMHTFQTVLFSMAYMQKCPATLAPLQKLTYSNGFNYAVPEDPSRIYACKHSIVEVGLKQNEFTLNFNIMYGILGGIIVIQVIMKLILQKFKKDLARQQAEYNRPIPMQVVHPRYFIIKRIYKFIFQRLYFVVNFMCMFTILFATGFQMSTCYPSQFLTITDLNVAMNVLAMCLLILFTTMVIFSGLYPQLHLFPFFMQKKYPVIYLVYTIIYIMLIAFLNAYNKILFLLFFMTVCNIVYLAFYRPYPESIHNFTIIFEQFIVLISLGVYIYEQLGDKTANNQTFNIVALFTIITMLYLAIFLSIYRLYCYYNYMKKNKLTYDDEQEIQHKKWDKDQQRSLITPRAKEEDQNKNKYIKDTIGKGKPFSNTPKHAKYEDDYVQEIKSNSNKNPLNNSKDYKLTNKSPPHNSKLQKSNDQQYDTFNRNKNQNNIFKIQKIDPKAEQIKKIQSNYNQSPYDRNGNIKSLEQDQYDALRAIKARLRKDFYQKVHGVEFKPNQNNQNYKSKIDKNPSNIYEPSDANDQL